MKIFVGPPMKVPSCTVTNTSSEVKPTHFTLPVHF